MKNTFLQIRNLGVCFLENQGAIFSDINIDIQKNTIFGIFGDTGCGKTTIAKCIAGFLSPENISGEIWLYCPEKIALHKQTQSFFQKHIRGKNIVYVPQDPYQTLNPFESLETQLQRIINLSNNKKSLADILQQVEFPLEKKEAMPNTLSAGQRQRATIALAMARSPQLLIFDEPTASLDRKTRRRLLDFFSQLVTKKQVTIIVISHEIFDYKNLIIEENRYYFQRYEENHNLVKRTFSKSEKILLETKEICKTYNNLSVLKNVNFLILENSWTYLEGKNGCGKSTLMNILSGILRADSGNIFWQKNKMTKKHYQKYIHLVFQDTFHSLNPNQKVKQILSEVTNCNKFHKKDLEEVCKNWYELLEIPKNIYNNYPKHISYGQQKRVVLLRTLLKYKLYTLEDPKQPHLFLLDEVFAGIHLPLRYKIMSLFIEIFEQQQNFSIVWIAHGQDQLREHCDYHYIFDNGYIE